LSQNRTVAPHKPILAAIPGALRPSELDPGNETVG
jgi:hypothetical protein